MSRTQRLDIAVRGEQFALGVPPKVPDVLLMECRGLDKAPKSARSIFGKAA